MRLETQLVYHEQLIEGYKENRDRLITALNKVNSKLIYHENVLEKLKEKDVRFLKK